MSTMKSTLAVVAATAVSIASFVSLALPGHAQGEEENEDVFVRHYDRKIAASELSAKVEYAVGGLGTTQERNLGPRRVKDVDAFEAISNGMPAAEVLAAIGPPSAKMRFAATKTTAWNYRYRDPWGDDSGFAVILDDNGVVVGKTRVRESG